MVMTIFYYLCSFFLVVFTVVIFRALIDDD